MTLTPQPASGRVARTLRNVAVVEFSALAFAAVLMRRHGFGAGDITAVVLGAYFGLRALFVAQTFRNGETHRSPRPAAQQIGPVAALRLFLAEYVTTVLAFFVLFPFERAWLPNAPQPAAPGRKTPVILVHGFICNRAYWVFFVRALQRARLGPVFTVTLEPVLGSIDEHARRLGEHIEHICRTTGAAQVALVGHSMGGLIGRAYVHGGGASRVTQLITLGSPHHGTLGAHALRAHATDARQMCVRSEWLMALNAHETRPCPVPITSILTPHDNIVFPQNSAWLNYPNARNRVFPGLGHVELVFSRAVMREVIEALRS